MAVQTQRNFAGANPFFALVLLQVFFLDLPDVKRADAQAVKGIHCAVGTGSCGNWLELGGYKTSCKSVDVFPSRLLLSAELNVSIH